jgi:hypothetical protein
MSLEIWKDGDTVNVRDGSGLAELLGFTQIVTAFGTATEQQRENMRTALEIGERNEPNGFAGIDSEGVLPAIVSVRRGTAAEIDAIVLNDGELAIVDVDGSPAFLRMGDGATSGGRTLFARGRAIGGVNFFDFEFSEGGNPTAQVVGISPYQIVVGSSLTGESFSIEFPSNDQTYYFKIPSVDQSEDIFIAVVSKKTTAGDKSSNIDGEIVVNTNSKTIKMYADGGWRTLASW